MINWKNLRDNPPTEKCNVCVKVGTNFETYKFVLHSPISWGLYKYPRYIDSADIPQEAMYINLDEIK